MDPTSPTAPRPADDLLAPAASSTDGRSGRDEAPTLARRRPARPHRERPSLLVVDDEPEVLSSVHDLLRLDYRVITCGDAGSALEILRSDDDIHVIMSDQRMPGMSGVELLRQAKAIRPEATRLLFTAYADIRTVIDAINQGHVFRYLAKPWDPDELQAVVRQAVEHHDLIVEKNRLVAELQAANAKLTEANRLKGAFLEVASHELNTPVSVILGLIELRRMAPGDALAGRPAVGRPHRHRGASAGPDRRAHAQAGPQRRIRPLARTASPSPSSRCSARPSTSSTPISSCAASPWPSRSIRAWGRSRPIRTRSPTS